jgi:transcriptional antiterminator NusG
MDHDLQSDADELEDLGGGVDESLLPSDDPDEVGWYVIHSYSGMENLVKTNLEHRIDSMDMADFVFDVIVPTETEIEIRDKKRREVEKRLYPGYVLVKMKLTDDSWICVRETPGVTGFVGIGHQPTALSSAEVDQIMSRIESKDPKVRVNFGLGERVRITHGPFSEFAGVVEELQPDKGKARIMVSIFGRDTPVEVEIVHLAQLG